MGIVIINEPRIDYVTMTTWHVPVYINWQEHVEPVGIEWETRQKVIQGYRGSMSTCSLGSVFLGIGKQVHPVDKKEYPHYMIKASGEVSDGVYRTLESITHPENTEYERRRVDCQVTIPLPDGYSAKSFYEAVQTEWSGRTTKLRLIENGTGTDLGMDTVYLWSRKSAKMVRFYVKQSSTGERFLRWEVEIKKELVRDFRYNNVVSSLMDTFAKLPLSIRMRPEMKTVIEATRGEHEPIHRRDRERDTVAWLYNVVKPAVVRCSKMHTTREHVGVWLDELIAELCDLDI